MSLRRTSRIPPSRTGGSRARRASKGRSGVLGTSGELGGGELTLRRPWREVTGTDMVLGVVVALGVWEPLAMGLDFEQSIMVS